MDKRILLKGGTVVDPSQELHGRADLVIEETGSLIWLLLLHPGMGKWKQLM